MRSDVRADSGGRDLLLAPRQHHGRSNAADSDHNGSRHSRRLYNRQSKQDAGPPRVRSCSREVRNLLLKPAVIPALTRQSTTLAPCLAAVQAGCAKQRVCRPPASETRAKLAVKDESGTSKPGKPNPVESRRSTAGQKEKLPLYGIRPILPVSMNSGPLSSPESEF